jgi:urease accessory protein
MNRENLFSNSTLRHAAEISGAAGDSRGHSHRSSAAADERWPAELHLRFAHHNDRTLLVENRHCGPLIVQKALYPEGKGICHAVIIHPPGGIAGGDDLGLEIELEAGSAAVLTTPGAARWYKAPRYPSRQQITIRMAKGSTLDWLPQENIFFNAARAESTFTLQIEPGATAIGWEIGLLGRQASAEKWLEGSIRSETSILDRNSRQLWVERMILDASSQVRQAPQGLAGYNVFGTLWAIGSGEAAALADELAPQLPFEPELRTGVTTTPEGILLVRAIAHDVERLRQTMIACWTQLRPSLHGLHAQPLRLWAT